MKKPVVLALLLLASGPAFAQSAASAPKFTANQTVEARVDQRIAQMKRQLAITPAQQQVWDAFAQTMRDNAASVDKAYKARTATIGTMSAPDNMRNFAQIEQARAQGVQTLAASFQTLYDTMSDSQKKTADAMFRRYGDRSGPRAQAPK